MTNTAERHDKTNGATLLIDGREISLDVLDGTVGPRVIDIRKLYADTGMFTFDPGYTSTSSC